MVNPKSAMAHLIQYAIDKGFSISVFDSEEWSLKRSTDKQVIIDEVNGVSEICNLRVWDLSGKYKAIKGTFAVFSGLEDEEDVIDYTVTPFADEWSAAFDAHITELEENE